MRLDAMKKYLIFAVLALLSPGVFANCNPVDAGDLTASVEQGYKDVKDSKATLMTCGLAVTKVGFGARKVFNDLKCCKEAVKENCTYRISKKRVRGPAACKLFAPWAM